MNFIIAILFLALTNTAKAGNEILSIGCTTKCDIFYRAALRKAARSNHVNLKIIDLSNVKKVQWESLDGILIPGGADINPQLYFSSIEQDLREYTQSLDYLVDYTVEGKKRDPFEYDLLKEYFSKEELKAFPIMGVCRGMQMLAVSQGIPLYVDIKTELGIRNRRYLYDRIHVENVESLMNKLFSNSFYGFKRHHQGIRVAYYNEHKDRWPHLHLTSYSNDGKIAESIEFLDRPIVGVQFHPENDFGHERKSLFGWFIKKSIENYHKKDFNIPNRCHRLKRDALFTRSTRTDSLIPHTNQSGDKQ